MRRWWPEALLVVLVLAGFLGCLSAVELWGKREQRAAAEAIDTVDHNHWLVAEIQGRPRLEKPPLPRWSIAALIKLTGSRDEWVVRLPGAITGVLTVALIYLFGLRFGSRELALASSFVLCSSAFFVGEMRQASNDGPLAFFTTLALYAAWRRLEQNREPAGGIGWCLLFHAALGLGALTKGPVILLFVGVTLIPFLALGRRLSWGLRKLYCGWGIVIFAALAMSWPAAVLFGDSAAARVWWLEMAEKVGFSQILEHHRHVLLMSQWPAMLLPWTLIAPLAVLLPFVVRKQQQAPGSARGRDGWKPETAHLWFPWWWGVGNLLVLCCWSVAKPNYYVPCVPGISLLIGAAWVELARAGQRPESRGQSFAARCLLQTQWVLFFVAAIVSPIVVRDQVEVERWPWCILIGLVVAIAVVASAQTWRRGRAALSLAPLAAACVIGFVVGYGQIAPQENRARGHRTVAATLDRIVSNGSPAPTLMFFNEIDEGLWFYARGFWLAPVPKTQPQYNTAFDLARSFQSDGRRSKTLSKLEAERLARQKQALLDWLDGPSDRARYLLIRDRQYDLFAAELAVRTKALMRETDMKRNELVLLEVPPVEPFDRQASRENSLRR